MIHPPLAQLAVHRALNARVLGSSPRGRAMPTHYLDEMERGYNSYKRLAAERIEIISDLLVAMGVTFKEHDLNAQGDIGYLLDRAKQKIARWRQQCPDEEDE